MWDSGAAGDYSELNSEESDSQEDIEEQVESEADEICTDQQEQSPNESSICKSFHFLEACSFIDFVDTNGEFIITAGRDHDIKMWDAAKEVVIRRFVGHTAPITGIKLQGPDPPEADLTVISSSEDGSIRTWSLQKGTEIRKIETENIITCMGIMGNKLVAIGNHKGRLDVHQLSTGQLYCSIVAHNDPVDALMVNDVHICTAVYDRPGSLRVWQLKWGKVICMYSLEEIFSIEFTSFTMYGDLIILGEATSQKLHILSYMSEETPDTLPLCEKPGYVQQVAVTDGLVLASTVDNNKMVHLHVYQLQDFDCLGTFYCKNMDRISSIALIKNHELKFILGGSALAMLKLEFSPRKEVMKTDSSSKILQQTEVNLKKSETIQDTVDENPKSLNIKSNTTAQCHQKQLALESFAQLPPIIKSQELKMQLKTDQKSCKHLKSEYWIENTHLSNPNMQEAILPQLQLKAKVEQKSNVESTVPIEELRKLELDSNKDQGDIQLPGEPVHEKQQKDNFLPEHAKKCADETSGINDLSQRIPRTLSQKQKYESENVRIIKVNKKQEERKKHNWFNFSKKKDKCIRKEQQKKSKEKDCMIM